MKICLSCGANIEGLIHHCDCCGAEINPQKKFWLWSSFECAYDFHTYVNTIMQSLQSMENIEGCADIEEISLGFYCYPDFMLKSLNIKKSVRYSSLKKNVQISMFVNYFDFVNADRVKKKQIVIHAILEALEMVEKRLLKSKRCLYRQRFVELGKISCFPYFRTVG